jgi:hypothetical protein
MARLTPVSTLVNIEMLIMMMTPSYWRKTCRHLILPVSACRTADTTMEPIDSTTMGIIPLTIYRL